MTAGFTLLNAGINDFMILEASSEIGGRLRKLSDLASYPMDLGAEWIHVPPQILETISGNANILNSIETVLHIPEEERVWYGPDEGFGENCMEYVDLDELTDYLFVNYTWFDFFNDTIVVPAVRKSIVHDCPVTIIDYEGNKNFNSSVVATCADGTQYPGTHILVTVPISILQEGSIEFRPTLPQAYQSAMMDIPVYPGLKAFLRFQEAFYPAEFHLDLAYDPAQLLFWDESYGESTRSTEHVLGVFVSDPASVELSALDDDALLASILATLDLVFDGNASRNFERGDVQNWQQEPYIKGTYSHYDKTWRQIDQLKEPVWGGVSGGDVVYFAGEALPAKGTDYENGFAHGAALSGMEAAEWILKELNGGSLGGKAAALGVMRHGVTMLTVFFAWYMYS